MWADVIVTRVSWGWRWTARCTAKWDPRIWVSIAFGVGARGRPDWSTTFDIGARGRSNWSTTISVSRLLCRFLPACLRLKLHLFVEATMSTLLGPMYLVYRTDQKHEKGDIVNGSGRARSSTSISMLLECRTSASLALRTHPLPQIYMPAS